MAVKIRLTRVGKRHAPIYRIVATDSRVKRDGKCLENLGTYNPMRKEFVQFHFDRMQEWINKGAQLTDSVARLRKVYAKAEGKDLQALRPVKAKKAKPAAEKKAPAKKAASKATKSATTKKATTTAKKTATKKTTEK